MITAGAGVAAQPAKPGVGDATVATSSTPWVPGTYQMLTNGSIAMDGTTYSIVSGSLNVNEPGGGSIELTDGQPYESVTLDVESASEAPTATDFQLQLSNITTSLDYYDVWNNLLLFPFGNGQFSGSSTCGTYDTLTFTNIGFYRQ